MTWGRGGSRNLETAKRVARALPTVLHVASGEGLEAAARAAREARRAGLAGVLAVRGDRADGGATGASVAAAAAAGASEEADGAERAVAFEVMVAGCPEAPPGWEDAPLAARAAWDAAKLGACGGRRVVTQACYEVGALEAYVAELRRLRPGVRVSVGVHVPSSAAALRRMLALAGRAEPGARAAACLRRLEACATPEAAEAEGVAVAAELWREVAARGLGDVHLYAMNRFDLALRCWRCAANHAEPEP